ncbi:MAG TPA: hypothetical protein VL598_14525 [Trinickia sp.]|uniref:hypothetical protein n=1 Tax=Trinickia sp. TaxID=2571163 RepID=UPI002B68C49A|nr:hypothetical protein [Trinickia sp.]HTI18872.1 hypothetical protein [Trinickia sp.]
MTATLRGAALPHLINEPVKPSLAPKRVVLAGKRLKPRLKQRSLSNKLREEAPTICCKRVCVRYGLPLIDVKYFAMGSMSSSDSGAPYAARILATSAFHSLKESGG